MSVLALAALELELDAFQLEYVNRLRQISTVSDISLGETKTGDYSPSLSKFASGFIWFKVCGIKFCLKHTKWENHDQISEDCVLGYQLASGPEMIIETLERWQKEQDDVGRVEERFRIE